MKPRVSVKIVREVKPVPDPVPNSVIPFYLTFNFVKAPLYRLPEKDRPAEIAQLVDYVFRVTQRKLVRHLVKETEEKP